MKRIEVAAAEPYPVLIGRGLLDQAGELAAERIMKSGKPGTLALVMDETVAGLYGSRVAGSFAKAGFRVLEYRFPAGEQSKNLERLSHLLEFLAEGELGRRDLIAALGGGVTGDLAGFAASVYQRGTPFLQLPTTLLAACDSSVGGKTAVNLRAGKNLAGSFWQPRLVLCDCDSFRTLPREELAAGAAECVKYALLGNPDLLDILTREGLDAPWEEILGPCVEQKSAIVALDEREQGARQLLNLGHTLGHAAEKLSGYSIRHGEGVAMGLMLITKAAEKMGICVPGLSKQLREALTALSLPVSCPWPPEELAGAALGDKKRRGDEITLVLPKKLGECVLHTVKTNELLSIARLGWEE